MFYVAGFPVKLMSEAITEADTLALIPITNKSITEFYPRAEIPACAPAPAAVRPPPRRRPNRTPPRSSTGSSSRVRAGRTEGRSAGSTRKPSWFSSG